MSSQLLLLLKFSLLALLYLFLLRVVRAVWAELSPSAPSDAPAPSSVSDRRPSMAAAGGVHPPSGRRGVPKSTPPTGAVAAVAAAGTPGMSTVPVTSATGAATLVVVAPPALAGQSVQVGAGGTLVGRGTGCDLVVEDSYVSQQHVRVSPAGPEQWWVEDLGSTNGTFVAGERVVAPRLVGRGQSVGLGGVVVELR